MKLFNSQTNRVEDFRPIHPDKVMMYVCGPTVYNHAHIGNARPLVVFDTLKKTLEALGYSVLLVSNYTDIDDKIIQLAQEKGVRESDISQYYIDSYEKLRHDLHVDPPYATPRVTRVMDDIIAFIQALMDKGLAYQVKDNVYFAVDRLANYGSLSHQQLDQLVAGSRVEENKDKHNPLDFVLWKNTDDTGIKWSSPWGQGRPGWHTECVVMIENIFKESPIDIHGGGLDLRFPHHENEQAQCCGLHQHPLANYWVHNAMINVDGEKMSKSLGNIWLAKDAIESLGANLVRWLLIQNHYRQNINVTEEVVETAKKEMDRLHQVLKQAHTKLSLHDISHSGLDTHYYPQFLEEMSQDLNTPNAIKVIFETVKALNSLLRQKEMDLDQVSLLFGSLQAMLSILGIIFDLPKMDDQVKELFERWNKAKQDKDFDQADSLRQDLMELGWL